MLTIVRPSDGWEGVGFEADSTPVSVAAPEASPEEVGLSSERLERINELVERHIEAGSFTGAVTLVARDGRIAHLGAHGLMNLEANEPMTC